MSKRRKRKSWNKGREKRPIRWLKLFPEEVRKSAFLYNVRPKIKEKILLGQPETQRIGRLREQKVNEALKNLKKKEEIRDYFWSGKLSYADLIEGVDFIFVYVDTKYKICRFSVTGWNWVEKHRKKHPDIPILPVGLKESRESIERKILSLKNSDEKFSHQ